MTNMDIYKTRECKPTFCMDENVWQAPASMHQCLHKLKTFRTAKKPTNASYLVMKNPLLAPNTRPYFIKNVKKTKIIHGKQLSSICTKN